VTLASLTQVVLDVERHASAAGWDQPPHLFGVVSTEDLLAREPQLATELDPSALAGPLTPLDQGELPWYGSLEASLARVAWPPGVLGAVLVTEQVVAGGSTQGTLATGADGGEELRLVVAVMRDGDHMCAVRFRSADEEDSVLTGAEIAPGLSEQLGATFAD